jgi:hypothetical protein
MRTHPCVVVALSLNLVFAAAANAESRYRAAMLSITTGELQELVATLADDVYEGRLAGSRGGRAAGQYIVEQLKNSSVEPAGVDGTYFQPCNQGYRNILALHRGNDPAVANEVILVSAHYDHVGYGNHQTSYGPIGYIHNGADDNASGVSALLEVIEALDNGSVQTRRPILFAFWDGEELGLIGSTHWVSQPTIPLSHVRWNVNVDMVGWLREGRLEVGGTRSGYGTRRLMCGHIERPVWLEFSWEMESNSDHWPLFQRGIPVTYLHTGLHDHYHRPSDDVERINHAGLQEVSRCLFGVLVEAADAPQLPRFRKVARQENLRVQRERERPNAPQPPRIGINWQAIAGEGDTIQGIELTRVVPGSPAEQAGLLIGDRIVAIDNVPVDDQDTFQQTLLAADGPVTLTCLRVTSPAIVQPDAVEDPTSEPVDIVIQPTGEPVRLGISWREDEAEPGTVYLTQVVPGSPAAAAGLEVLDRVYEVDRHQFATSTEFGNLVAQRLDAGATEMEFLAETTGYVRPLVIRFPLTRIADRPSRSGIEQPLLR